MNRPNKYTPYALIFLAGVIVYLPVLFNYFCADDFLWIRFSNEINWTQLLQNIQHNGITLKLRWMQNLLFQIFFVLFGLKPVGYHLGSLILHIANGVLLFKLLSELFKNKEINLLASLIFVTHFSHEESLFWLSAISGPLVCLFYLLSLLLFLTFLKRKVKIFSWLSYITYFAALFSKEESMTLPLAIFLMAWLLSPKENRKFTTALRSFLPYFIISFCFIIIRASVRMPQTFFSIFPFNPLLIVFNLAYFLVNFILPVRTLFDLTGYQFHDQLESLIKSKLQAPMVILGLVVLAIVILFIIIYLIRKYRAKFILTLTILLMAMFPYIIMHGNGQRFTYLSMAVFSFIAANLLYNFLAKQFLHQPHLFKRIVVVLGLLIVIFNLGIIYERSFWWRKAGNICEQTIYEAAEIISSNPENSTIYFSNLPKRIHGAYIMPLRNSFGESMKLFVSTSHKEIMDLEIYQESELEDIKNLKTDYLFYYKDGRFKKVVLTD